jgi:hypothetical protein
LRLQLDVENREREIVTKETLQLVFGTRDTCIYDRDKRIVGCGGGRFIKNLPRSR